MFPWQLLTVWASLAGQTCSLPCTLYSQHDMKHYRQSLAENKQVSWYYKLLAQTVKATMLRIVDKVSANKGPKLMKKNNNKTTCILMHRTKSVRRAFHIGQRGTWNKVYVVSACSPVRSNKGKQYHTPSCTQQGQAESCSGTMSEHTPNTSFLLLPLLHGVLSGHPVALVQTTCMQISIHT